MVILKNLIYFFKAAQLATTRKKNKNIIGFHGTLFIFFEKIH